MLLATLSPVCERHNYCRPQVCSREDLHLGPSPSHGDMHDSYTSGALCKNVGIMPVLPRVRRTAVSGLEDPRRAVRHARCYINDVKLEAVSRPKLFRIRGRGLPLRRSDFSPY